MITSKNWNMDISLMGCSTINQRRSFTLRQQGLFLLASLPPQVHGLLHVYRHLLRRLASLISINNTKESGLGESTCGSLEVTSSIVTLRYEDIIVYTTLQRLI